MRRFAIAALIGFVLLAMGYVASGVGTAGTTRASDSTTTGTTTTTASTSTSVSTSTTTTTTSTTTTTPAPKKVTICHRTKSKKRPYVKITVSGAALKAHMKHKGDIIPAPATGCPSQVVLVKNHKIVKKKK